MDFQLLARCLALPKHPSTRRHAPSRSHAGAHSRVQTVTRSLLRAAAFVGALAPSLYAQSTTLVSVDGTGVGGNGESWTPSLSSDGRHVAFASLATALVEGDTNAATDVFVHDRQSGHVIRASVGIGGVEGNTWSTGAALSADGLACAFTSGASNLVVGDVNGRSDVFVRDFATNTTILVSCDDHGVQGDRDSQLPRFSLDGRYVVFESYATNLVRDDHNGTIDVFLHDLVTGRTSRVSLAADGTEANKVCSTASISADDRFVAFQSHASNLVAGDVNGMLDVFVRDRQVATTRLVSVSTSGAQGDDQSWVPEISADGRFVTFTSAATNLVANDTNGMLDVFVRDLVAGTTSRVSLGAASVEGNGYSFGSAFSADARFVAFASSASNFVVGDTNAQVDVFVRDVVVGTTTRVSVGSSGLEAHGSSGEYVGTRISADGELVAFTSWADDLVPTDVHPGNDVFVHERSGCSPTIASYCTAGTSTQGCTPSLSASGTPDANAGSGFVVTANGVDGQRNGLCLYGVDGSASIPFGGANVLCIRPPVQRLPVANSGGTSGACDGQLSFDWNQFVATHPQSLGAPFAGGETVWLQLWIRDPQSPIGAVLSNALWCQVCP